MQKVKVFYFLGLKQDALSVQKSPIASKWLLLRIADEEPSFN